MRVLNRLRISEWARALILEISPGDQSYILDTWAYEY